MIYFIVVVIIIFVIIIIIITIILSHQIVALFYLPSWNLVFIFKLY